MNNELTNANGMEMDLFFGGNGLTGFEDIDQTDLSIGKVKLLQMQSEEAIDKNIQAGAGDFYNVQTGESYSEIKCTLLSISKSRARFEQPYKKGTTALCSSIDCKVATTKDGHKVKCDGCKYSDWNKARQDGKDKPDCTQSYVLLGAMLDDDNTPFRYTVGGAAFKTIRKFISQVAIKGAALFTYDISLTSNLVNSAKGAYYEPVVKIEKAYTPAEIKALAPEVRDQLFKTFTDRQELLKSLKDIFENARRHDAITGEGEIIDAEATEVMDETGSMF